jgi:hypothetical protein
VLSSRISTTQFVVTIIGSYEITENVLLKIILSPMDVGSPSVHSSVDVQMPSIVGSTTVVVVQSCVAGFASESDSDV